MTTASAPAIRQLPSWIDAFVEYTDGLPTPLEFRQWAAISTLASLLERRVWVTSARQPVYPNLYTLLVGPPGVGKSKAISTMQDVIRQLTLPGRQLHIAPDDMTPASLIDNLAKAGTRLVMSDKELFEYHTLSIGASEISVLLPQHDMQFISKLIHFYDSPDHPFEESRRGTREHPTIIPKPQLNILAGTTPSYLGHLMPEQAWTMGFTSRVILIFAGNAPELDLFAPAEDSRKKAALWLKIMHDAKIIAQQFGEIKWTEGAMEIVTNWYRGGLQPVPDHPKLMTYNARRLIHAMKLITVATMSSNSQQMLVTPETAATGISWMLHAEQVMPEIFKDISANQSGGAGSAMTELHYFAMREFNKNGNNAIHVSRLIVFLGARVPSYQVMQIIDLAERSRLLERVAGTQDMFIPKSRMVS